MEKIAKKPKQTLKEILKNKIPKSQIEKVNRSFEIVGDIAITEIDEELKNYEKQIGEAIMQTNKSIKVVLKKSGIHKGEFRTQDLIHIAGENRKETIYLENGIKLKINPETVYFSARLSTERDLLMKNLKPNKKVLIMFSGIGPYTFNALKKQPNLAQITSIEINPDGHKYALENLELNKNLIKKSSICKDTIKFLKDNQIPIYEKKLVEILNQLKIHFINGDVRKEIENLKLKETKTKIENYHNELFKQSPKDIFEFLKQANLKTINLNFDKNKPTEAIKYLALIFSQKFDFICTINKKNYIFDDELTKGYLLNYLETNQIENINLFDEIFMPLPKDAELFLDCAFKTSDKNAIVHMYDFVHENDFPHKSEDAVKKAAEKHKKKIKIIETRKVGQYSPRKYRICCDFNILK